MWGGVEVRVQRSPWSVLACCAEAMQETLAHALSSRWSLIIISMFAGGKTPKTKTREERVQLPAVGVLLV